MVFTSIEFLWFFLPAVIALYLLLPPAARNALLAAMSVFFYASGGHALVFMFLASIAFNYAAGLLIARYKDAGEASRAVWTTRIAVTANLACLFFWKYAVFAFDQVGVDDLGIVLPLGISFFTFHGISYVVDVHRGAARPMRRVADYAPVHGLLPAADRRADRPLPRDRRSDPQPPAALAAARRLRRRVSRASRSAWPRRW